MDHSAQTDCIS